MSAQSASDANPFPHFDETHSTDFAPSPPRGPVPLRPSRRRVHDGSRTCFESRVAFGSADEDAEEIPSGTRRFTLLETTSGLPDDSREEDERRAERRLRELRGRVRRARAVVSTTPGLAETLVRDWQKAAQFYAHFGTTENLFRHGVPADSAAVADDLADHVRAHCDGSEELRARQSAALSDSGPSLYEPTR